MVVVTMVVATFTQPAGAHVTVQPPEANQGGYAKLTFRVPNERDATSTVGLRVSFPEDHPFASVSVKPKSGWTAEVVDGPLAEPAEVHGETVTEAVTEVSWSGGEIKPGEFDEFEVSVGPLPDDVDVLYFPAIQIYSDGEEVLWSEEPSADGEEPELPAPELTLLAASGDEHGHGGDDATTDDVGEQAAATSSDDHDDSSSTTLAIVALVVAALGLVLGGLAFARSGRSPGSTT
jgi:uncharacterized protein YcnI